MSVRNKEIIAATTNLAFSLPFQPIGMATITAGTLGENEGVQIQYSNDGINWQSLYLNGVLQEITAEHSMITIAGPGKFRCLKSATVNAVSVNIWGSEEI